MSVGISIIVPVYNVEKYLNECVESLLNQDFENKEIILVNDGSTDNSPQICDEYAKKYDFIKVIHKPNGGLSDARNTGLSQAEKEYVLFVDSDDFIAENSVCKIAEVASKSNADVVFLEAKKYMPDKSTVSLGDGITAEKVRGVSYGEAVKNISACPKFPGSACTKLIKKELFDENDDLKFKKGLLSEDIDWCLKLLCTARSFDYCGADYYYYRQNREGSITNTMGKKNISDLLYIVKKWTEISKTSPEAEKLLILNSLSYEYPIILAGYGGLKKTDKKELEKEIKEYRWLAGIRKGLRYSMVKWIISLFGVNFTALVLNFYLKHR